MVGAAARALGFSAARENNNRDVGSLHAVQDGALIGSLCLAAAPFA